MGLPRFKGHKQSTGKDLNFLLDYLTSSMPNVFTTGDPEPVSPPVISPFVTSITGTNGITASPLTGNVHLTGGGGGGGGTPYIAKAYKTTVSVTTYVDTSGNNWYFTMNQWNSPARVGYGNITSDPYSEFDANGTFTAHVTGTYLIVGRSTIEGNTEDPSFLYGTANPVPSIPYRMISVMVNGSNFGILDSTYGKDNYPASTSSIDRSTWEQGPLFGATVLPLAAGDKVDIFLQIVGAVTVEYGQASGPGSYLFVSTSTDDTQEYVQITLLG